MTDSTDYGVLSHTVTTAAALVAAAGAIGLSWKGRSKWEPVEADVSRGPQKVAGLAAAVLIGIARARLFGRQNEGHLELFAFLGVGLTLLSLIFYGTVISLWTYEKRFADGNLGKVIGGSWPIPAVAKRIGRNGKPSDPTAGPPTLQKAFEASAFDKDAIWSRAAQTVAKQLFVLGYVGLVVCGSTALALTAMAIDLAVTTSK